MPKVTIDASQDQGRRKSRVVPHTHRKGRNGIQSESLVAKRVVGFGEPNFTKTSLFRTSMRKVTGSYSDRLI